MSTIRNFLREKLNIGKVNPKQAGRLTYEEAEKIVQEFGRFLAERQPTIKDARLLPYPKETIDQALVILISNLKKQWGSQVKKLIDALEFSQVALKAYAPIDLEDQQLVDYFNKFGSASQVPKEQQKAFIDLLVKYQTKGMGV